ncbi:MAG: hypothetical protein RMY29_034105 [Nostoc sp. CreGUA01]|nr:hypothetical protein [Nostoc sp. CreGUA01]
MREINQFKIQNSKFKIKELLTFDFFMPNAQCPMPHAQCPIPKTQ